MAPAASPIVDADGTIFFAVYNVLIAANPNGTEKWRCTFPTMRGISELSLGSDGTLYLGFSGSLYARYANNGTQKWACPLGADSDNRGAPTVGLDGNIYYVSLEGYFIGINSQGNIVQQLYLDNVFSSSSPNTSPALAPDGTAYFGGGGGQDNTATGLYAVQTTSYGLADSPWPKFMHDNKNTGQTSGGPEPTLLNIDEAKIDWKKKPEDDKIRVQGSFTLPSTSGINPGDLVTVIIGKFAQSITMDVKDNGKKWEFKRNKDGTGIKDMKLEFKKNEITFEIHVDKEDLVDMAAWGDPHNLFVSLQIGDDKGSATIDMKVQKDKWEYHK